MKLKKQKSVKMDTSVYALIAEQFGAEIPIMKDLPRDEKSISIGFSVMSRVKLMADKIVSKLDRFDLQADVHRAAHYLGLFILYNILVDDLGDFKYKSVYDNLMNLEEINSQYQIVNDATYTMRKIYKNFRSGLMSASDMNRKMDEIIGELPENLQELTRSKKEMIISGATLNEIALVRGRGIKEQNG